MTQRTSTYPDDHEHEGIIMDPVNININICDDVTRRQRGAEQLRCPDIREIIVVVSDRPVGKKTQKPPEILGNGINNAGQPMIYMTFRLPRHTKPTNWPSVLPVMR